MNTTAVRKRFPISISFLSVIAMTFSLFVSCSGGGGDGSGTSGKSVDASGDGMVTFQLRIDEREAEQISLMAAEFDCVGNQIATIVVEVYDDGTGELLATGGPWDCEAGEGLITGILAGANRSVRAYAIDADGLVIFRGEVRGITVIAGQTTAVGVIFLTKVTNRPPVMDTIADQAVDEGMSLVFSVTASDPDMSDILTLSVSDLPVGAEFNAESGLFTWTPGFEDAGNYRVMFIASDDGSPPLSDSRNVTITVGNVNRPPVLDPIGPRGATEDVALTFTVTGSDPDQNNLSFSASDLPDGANFDPDTGVFSWVPGFESAGVYEVLFRVADDGVPPLSDHERVTITVGNVNRPPVIDPIGNRGVDENELLQFRVTGSDPDGDALTFSADIFSPDMTFNLSSSGFSLSDLPSGAQFNPETQTFRWQPGFDDAGNYPIVFTASDDGEPPLSVSETVTITVGNVNRPPVLDPIGNRSVDEGGLIEFAVTGTDPDNDRLTFSASGLPSSARFDPETQIFRWWTSQGDWGGYSVSFKVTDDAEPSLSDSEVVFITVFQNEPPPPQNRPPVLAPIGNRSVNTVLEERFRFTVTASDPDSPDLVFDAQPLPPGASFSLDVNPASNFYGLYVFDWFPTSDDVGNYTVRFTVTDNGEPPKSDFEDVTLTVGMNSPPSFIEVVYGTGEPIPVSQLPTPFPMLLSAPGQTVSLTVTATDFDDDTMTYSASDDEIPSGASFNPDTRTLTWTPTQAGTESATFTVVDDGDPPGSDTLTVTFQVYFESPFLQ